MKKNSSFYSAFALMALSATVNAEGPTALINGQASDRVGVSVSGAQFEDSVWRPPEFMAPDACSNMIGYQASPPAGFVRKADGSCVTTCTAPDPTSAVRAASCPAGHTGSQTILTTTTYSCPDPYGAPVSSSVDAVASSTCTPASTWPWENFYGARTMAIHGKVPDTLNGRLNSSGNLYGWDYVPTYVLSGTTYQSAFSAQSFDKTRAFLTAQGYRMITMRRQAGGTGEYYSYWNFIAEKDGLLYLGVATKGTMGRSKCYWGYADECGTDTASKTYHIQFPIRPYHVTYSWSRTTYTSTTWYTAMTPTYLGQITDVQDFNTGSLWRYVNLGAFNVYISQPYRANDFVCETPVLQRWNSSGAYIGYDNYIFNRYCQIGGGFRDVSTSRERGRIPEYWEWTIPYNQ